MSRNFRINLSFRCNRAAHGDRRQVFGLDSADSGMALPVVLIFTAAILLFGTAFLHYALNEQLIASYQAEEVMLNYIIEAGLEAGIAAVYRDFEHREPLSGTLGDGRFRVQFSAPGLNERRIESTGSLGDYERTYAVTVKRDSAGNLCTEWINPYPQPEGS